MSEQTSPDIKALYVNRQEAELILDSFKVSSPITRDLALKAASLVLEFVAADAVAAAGVQLLPASPPASG